MPSAWRSADRTTQLALGLIALIYLGLPPALLLLGGIPHYKHTTTGATVAALVIAYGIVVALVVPLLRGRRWAWVVLLLFAALGLVQSIVNFRASGLAVDVAVLSLLVSPPVRRYVEPRRREAS
jgi:hypothetical protein